MLGEMWANYHDVAILFSSQVRPFMANREELWGADGRHLPKLLLQLQKLLAFAGIRRELTGEKYIYIYAVYNEYPIDICRNHAKWGAKMGQMQNPTCCDLTWGLPPCSILLKFTFRWEWVVRSAHLGAVPNPIESDRKSDRGGPCLSNWQGLNLWNTSVRTTLDSESGDPSTSMAVMGRAPFLLRFGFQMVEI